MRLRWSGSPQPITPIVQLGGQTGVIIDSDRLSIEPRIDIYPGDSGLLDTAVRFDNDAECYGWTNANYSSNPQWRNPDWKIPAGRFLVKVEVVSAGERCDGIFRLVNDVARSDFRLEPKQRADRVVN